MGRMKCPANHDMAVMETTQAAVGDLPGTRRRYRCGRCKVEVTTYEVVALAPLPAVGGPNPDRPAAVVTYRQLKAMQQLSVDVARLAFVKEEDQLLPTKTGRRRRMPQKITCSAFMPCDDPRCGHCKTLPMPGVE